MSARIQQLNSSLTTALGGKIASLTEALDELTLVVKAGDYLGVAQTLRDTPELGFSQLIHQCGVDYS